MTYVYLKSNLKKIRSIIGDRTLFVIGHQIPDVDSYVSSLLLSNLLNKEGINAVPTLLIDYNLIDSIDKSIIEKINCGRILKHVITDNDYVFLVDHNDPFESYKNIHPQKVLGIVDHHEDNHIDGLLKIVKPSGSTSKLIFEMYNTLGYTMTYDEEVQVLYSLLIDTCGLTVNRGGSDEEVLARKLSKKLNLDLLRCKKESIFETDLEKPMEELQMNFYKEYKINGKRIASSGIEFFGDRPQINERVKNITHYMKSKKSRFGQCYCHVFIHRDFYNKRTTAYYILDEHTHEVAYPYIASRGSTILPDFKKWLCL
ncbi:DHH family phosphoesterase [Vallitalea okinawensis]|uniref:DHH family phosphoesterase n=1 Tax=Vallitalea okinawensis TaxID=2078660 RepID=UPI000CFD0429|nr:DHH family phosphoesterase [Vallitalea okinawensis]